MIPIALYSRLGYFKRAMNLFTDQHNNIYIFINRKRIVNDYRNPQDIKDIYTKTTIY